MTFDTENLAEAATATEPETTVQTETSAGVDAGTDSSNHIAQPRIRFGTIVWGLLVFAAGATLLTALRTPGQRDQFVGWALSLSPSDSLLIVAIIVGAIVLVLGLLAVIRSQQKRWSRR
jgi:hypothetical protein